MENKILIIVVLLFFTGMISYHFLEGWSWINSLYFSVTTLTTIGYGDLYPTTDVSKLFTILYVITGISIVLYVLSNLQQELILLENRIERHIRKNSNIDKKKRK